MSAPEDAEVVGWLNTGWVVRARMPEFIRANHRCDPWAVQTYDLPLVRQSALLAEQAARQRAEAERDEARQIVRDIHWMARRYADGRQSYAVSQCNDALRKGFDAGWLEWKMDDQESRYARDGMFSPEWKGLEQRLAEKEAEVAELRAKLERAQEDAEQEAYRKIENVMRNRAATGIGDVSDGISIQTACRLRNAALVRAFAEERAFAAEAVRDRLAKRKEGGK